MHSFCRDIVTSAAPLRIPNGVRFEPANGGADAGDFVAFLGAPIFANERPVGALCVLNDTPREWRDDELAKLLKFAVVVSNEIARHMAIKESKQLRQEQWEFLRLFRHAPAMLQSVAQDGRIIAVSDRWLAELGYERHEVLGRQVYDYLTPASAEFARSTAQSEFRKNGMFTSLEIEMVRKSGQIMEALHSCFMHQEENSDRYVAFSVITDISERKQLERDKQLLDKRYQSIVESQEELICRFNPNFEITFVNYAYSKYFQRDDLIGTSILDLMPEKNRQNVIDSIRSMQPGKSNSIEHETIMPDGTNAWQMWTDQVLVDEQGNPIEYQSVGKDITERKIMEEQIRRLVTHDYLTDLPNRLALDKELARCEAEAIRRNSIVAITLIDVDNFKSINDTLGHRRGDSFLIELSRHLKNQVRQADFVGRISGDEFVIVAEDAEDEGVFGKMLDRLISEIGESELLNGLPSRVNISAGLSIFPSDGNDMNSVRNHADAALYSAKSAGGACWRRYRHGMPQGRACLDQTAQLRTV